MHNLFSLLPEVGQGIMKFPEWLYVRDGLTRNLASVQTYYRRNPTAVVSSHFLVRLLHSITVPQSHNLERYYDNVDSIALNLSMALKMTSSIFQGKLWDGVFYGPGNTEILIANSESFDPVQADAAWQDQTPVQVLRHPMSDLGLPILDGKRNYGTESGLVVLSINIPLLAVMYRAFRNNEAAIVDAQVESERSVMQFLRMYVLPNMLASHLDLAVFNRIDNLEKGAPLGASTYKHPFYMTDYSHRVDYVQEHILENLHNVGKNFTGVLRSIPVVSKANADEVMAVPQMAPTRQVLWALVISRLNAINFMFRINREGPGMRNQSEVNRAKRMALMYKSDSLMRNVLPLELYMEVQSEIDGILENLA